MPDSQLGPGARRIIHLREHDDEVVPEIVIDHWQRLRDDEPYPTPDTLPVLVSLVRWLSEREQLAARPSPVGVWIPGHAEPEEVGTSLASLPLVAVEIPKFSDGRHFTLARLLRERYGFAGELRAFGDVLPDQLFYMRRCGYTSFELKPGKSLETGLQTLQTFSVAYQAGADLPPLYRRR